MTDRGVVRTVLGDVPVESWGVTNAHAHLSSDLFSHHHDQAYADFIIDVSMTEPELRDFAAAGGHALVELTPAGLGRDPAGVRQLARRAGVHVVMGTGIYHQAFHPAHLADMSEREICAMFVREITEGIDGTDVRAGIIGEIGTYQDQMTNAERRVFRAAAWAAKETGVAVTTHTYLGQLALEQIDVLTAAGLAPERIVIGHLDDLTPLNLDLVREIIRRGAWAQFDAVGCEYFSEALQAQMPTDAERLAALTTLAEEGLDDRIIFASDICRKRHLRVNGGPGLAHLAGRFREFAAEQGVPSALVDRVLCQNPAIVLTMASP